MKLKRTLRTSILCLVAAVLLVVAACEKTGTLSATANGNREGFGAEKVIDGDRATGFVSDKVASATLYVIEINIDLGKKQTVQKVTLDDTFSDGFTNETAAYQKNRLSLKVGDAGFHTNAPIVNNNPVNKVFDGGVGGNKFWQTDIVPTDDAPVYFNANFRNKTKISKVEMDNSYSMTAPVHFAVYAATTELSAAAAQDKSNYTKLFEVTDNDKEVYAYALSEQIEAWHIFYEVYDQSGEAVILDELTLYEDADGEAGEHYPVHFALMYSLDGEEFEEFYTTRSNSKALIEIELEQALEARYIKYIVFKELDDNYASMGEIIVCPVKTL